ncbi:MAG: acetylxylan esterase [Planctomycetales bacterium]|nr:acetylxylan esterase [Planctomycetales bacterium]
MHTQPNRRQLLQAGAALASIATLAPGRLLSDETNVPQSVAELWADFDPRREPLEVEIIREWQEDGGLFRLVRYRIGTFKGQPARMAAIYGFPADTTERLPAVMHIHGGGQRAFLHEVKLLVARGYAGLSINWGGNGDGRPPFNSPDGARPGDPNTDWGAVDPSQLNVAGYSSMLPGPKQFFEDREHPKNNNWYLLTLGCRRGLTFLEQQPEVDPERLGVHGYSMGGNLTMYVAGSDNRVKAAVPGVGGQGWRWQPHEFLGGTAQQNHIRGDVEVFRRTLSFESYAPRIQCPVLHRSATNDFHGWMDDVYRTNALIENQSLRYCWAPHLNHRLTHEVEVAMPLWFDQFLKGGPALPETPATQLSLDADDHVPVLRVRPKSAWPIARCEIYYSVDPDPRARFWRSGDVIRTGDAFTAKLPLHALDAPLFAFANVHYTLPEPVSLNALPGHREPIREVCLSSQLHRVEPPTLAQSGIVATASPSPLIDDFSHGLRDWYQLNAGNLAHQQTWTRKVTDPIWRGPDAARLRFSLTMPQTNRLTFVVHENEWRDYRGRRQTYICQREITGSDKPQTVTLAPGDFQSTDASRQPLTSWRELDQLGICAHFADRRESPQPSPTWNGPDMTLLRVEWA